MNTKTLIAAVVVAGAVAAVGSQATADKGRPRVAEIQTITGTWSTGHDAAVFTATQEDGSATKVQGLELVNSDGSPVIVNVCPAGQEWADVVMVRKITTSFDPIPGAGSRVVGPYVIRTPVTVKGIRFKVWGDQVQTLIPVPCPDYEPPTKRR